MKTLDNSAKVPQMCRFLSKFVRDTRGAALVEFALCLPVLLVFLGAAAVLQDAIRLGYMNSKASYTIGDIASREDVPIDAEYFDRLRFIQNSMIGRLLADYPRDLRMTTLECTANCTNEATRVIEVCWSEASTGFAQRTAADADFDALVARTPLFASGDTMLVTESYLDYTPPAFRGFFVSQRYESISFTRPRLVTQIQFDTGATDTDGEPILRDCFNNA